ncbi:uncharacterized protein LOC120331811 isoform X3 [Styela clava]
MCKTVNYIMYKMDDNLGEKNVPVGKKASQEAESIVDQPGSPKNRASQQEKQFKGQSEKNAERKIYQKIVLDEKPKTSEDFFKDEPESQKLSATPHRSQIKEKTKEKPDKKQKSALEEKPTKKAFLDQQPSDDMGQQPPSDMGQRNRDRQ